jgi:ABC-type polysaccharide/polyol phosphate transport system ATPase subunit
LLLATMIHVDGDIPLINTVNAVHDQHFGGERAC